LGVIDLETYSKWLQLTHATPIKKKELHKTNYKSTLSCYYGTIQRPRRSALRERLGAAGHHDEDCLFSPADGAGWRLTADVDGGIVGVREVVRDGFDD
jgi:hypothetical protein